MLAIVSEENTSPTGEPSQKKKRLAKGKYSLIYAIYICRLRIVLCTIFKFVTEIYFFISYIMLLMRLDTQICVKCVI